MTYTVVASKVSLQLSIHYGKITVTPNVSSSRLNGIKSDQDPITRSLQLPHIPFPVTAFSQTDLFLVSIYLEFRSPQEPQ